MTVRLLLGALATLALTACARTAESATPASPAITYGPDSATVVMDTALLRKADLGRITGDSTAKVIVLEVSDFQCPYCKVFHDSTYSLLRSAYVDNGKVRMAYVNLPLRGHRNAWPAAEAAMCASVQGKFWTMHDSLFDAQPRWEDIAKPDTMFARFARTLALDEKGYASCMTTHATRPLIASDAERSSSAGISGTPAFIIGDSLLSGAYPFADFRRVIDANLAASAPR
ncbi:MAG: thioredoxin domain-containing protein [Gemmatimonadaceae bacterium]|nr:thioredoxin domain-containing protein [Gemmatimonadaceae bacterium]